MRTSIIPAAILTLGLAACGSPSTTNTAETTVDSPAPAAAEATEAVATLKMADGRDAGTVTSTQIPDGLHLVIKLENLPAGMHGAHIHTTGACEPNFMAAGGHWAPFDQEFKLDNDDASDDSPMAMIDVAADGTGSADYTLHGDNTLQGLLEGDGSSFMIHATKGDPSISTTGPNGDRIACGVFDNAGGLMGTASPVATTTP